MTQTEITVRDAQQADLPALLRLYRQLTVENEADEADVAEVFSEITSSKWHRLLVAEITAEVVGTVYLVISPNIGRRGRPWAVVENVVVDAAHRRRGVASALLTCAERIAKESGCYKVFLGSSFSRSEAHLFYERCGWKRDGYRFTKTIDP